MPHASYQVPAILLNMTTPQNRLSTGRDNVGRFVQGVTGNPGGRPKGLASYVREIAGDDGKMLVDGVLELLRQSEASGKGGIQAQRFQLECIQWLADRGFGKAVLSVEHTGSIGHNWDAFPNMSDDDVQALVDAARVLLAAKANVIEHEPKSLPEPGSQSL